MEPRKHIVKIYKFPVQKVKIPNFINCFKIDIEANLCHKTVILV